MEWPEPIVRVQSISESGTTVIPKQYIKPPSRRPSLPSFESDHVSIKIPTIDLSEDMDYSSIVTSMSEACREWGFFHLANHGVSPVLLKKIRSVWKEFFYLSMDEKNKYANNPVTYEGYGSRLGVMKGANLDWGDYFHLNFLPVSLQDQSKWPSLPSSCRYINCIYIHTNNFLINSYELKLINIYACRDTIEEYGREVAKVYSKLMRVISKSLELEEDDLWRALGGSEFTATMRVNFYPKCPQPDLTLGFSTHSDPGSLTILLPDDHVKGLQIRKDGSWLTVDSIPDVFVVNIADQIQVSCTYDKFLFYMCSVNKELLTYFTCLSDIKYIRYFLQDG